MAWKSPYNTIVNDHWMTKMNDHSELPYFWIRRWDLFYRSWVVLFTILFLLSWFITINRKGPMKHIQDQHLPLSIMIRIIRLKNIPGRTMGSRASRTDSHWTTTTTSPLREPCGCSTIKNRNALSGAKYCDDLFVLGIAWTRLNKVNKQSKKKKIQANKQANKQASKWTNSKKISLLTLVFIIIYHLVVLFIHLFLFINFYFNSAAISLKWAIPAWSVLFYNFHSSGYSLLFILLFSFFTIILLLPLL